MTKDGERMTGHRFVSKLEFPSFEFVSNFDPPEADRISSFPPFQDSPGRTPTHVGTRAASIRADNRNRKICGQSDRIVARQGCCHPEESENADRLGRTFIGRLVETLAFLNRRDVLLHVPHFPRLRVDRPMSSSQTHGRDGAPRCPPDVHKKVDGRSRTPQRGVPTMANKERIGLSPGAP